MSDLLLWWLALAVALFAVVIGDGRRSGPLVMAYFVGLSMLHVPGALTYVGEATSDALEEPVKVGFQAVLSGLGCLLLGALAARVTTAAAPTGALPFRRATSQTPTTMIAAGLVAYFVAMPAAALIPSAAALLSSVASLLIVGFWSYFYETQRTRARSGFLLGIAALPLLPLSTAISGGFLGFGVDWMISVVSAIFVLARRKLIYVVVFPVIVFAGLSVAVAYFNDREALRRAVWYENAGISSRLDVVEQMLVKLEPFDVNNAEHVRPLRGRLNESYHLGLGIERHRAENTPLYHGATVQFWALIPRAIWPEKPQVGGGGELVSAFTGQVFARGTSVGAGQPLEFYMNFGMSGIWAGFFLWGFVLAWLDIKIRIGLETGNLRLLLRAGLPGLAMLSPGGNLLEILVSAAASVFVAHAMAPILERLSSPRQPSARTDRPPFRQSY